MLQFSLKLTGHSVTPDDIVTALKDPERQKLLSNLTFVFRDPGVKSTIEPRQKIKNDKRRKVIILLLFWSH